jgi:hypothetical protein
LNMRQKIISLSLDTYELASKKANFSAWVRRKLLEEVKEAEIEYGAYCDRCDITFARIYKSSMLHYNCDKCGNMTTYLGELE